MNVSFEFQALGIIIVEEEAIKVEEEVINVINAEVEIIYLWYSLLQFS